MPYHELGVHGGAYYGETMAVDPSGKHPHVFLKTQVGGDHYTKYRIQPITYCIANHIPFAEGAVIKYVTRWRDKGGVEDLKKARHMLDMLIEHEENTK